VFGSTAAPKETQWLGMMRWMQESEPKWDDSHQDDKLWEAGISNMMAKVLKRMGSGQEASEKETDKTAKMDS
jgi:hypothetical protein